MKYHYIFQHYLLSPIHCSPVINQFTGLCSRSALHSMQPIELNFSEGSAIGSASNTIQISMDCITMRGPEEPLTVSTSFHLTHSYSLLNLHI